MKRPVAAYILALLYVVTPFLSFLATLQAYEGGPLWSLKTWIYWGSQVSSVGWGLFALLLVSGCCLFLRRKWSWTLALVTLIVSVGANLVSAYFNEGLPPINFEVSIGTALSLGVLLFYFRFPYFDRREGFMAVAHRYTAGIQGDVSGTQVLVLNLSQSGALIEHKSIEFTKGAEIELRLGNKLALRARVVRVQEGHRSGVEFLKLRGEPKKLLNRVIENLRGTGPLTLDEFEDQMKRRLPFLYN